MKNILRKDWEMLRDDAKNIINSTDILNMTDNEYAMFGASLAILSSNIADDENSIAARMETVDFVPTSYADELRQESLACFVEYSNEKSLEVVTGSEKHGEKAQKALDRMLETDYEIAKSLMQTADSEEQELIRKCYIKMSKL